MKSITKKLCILLAVLTFIPINSVYANNYSVKEFINGDLLRNDGNYYEDIEMSSIVFSNKRAKANVIDINKDGFYVTSDNVLHYYYNDEKIKENVVMISDCDINDNFYFLDSNGNLNFSNRTEDGKTDTTVIKNIGKLKGLYTSGNSAYALSEKGEFYNINSNNPILINTDVKSIQLLDDKTHYIGEGLYLKNDNSLYSYNSIDKKSNLLLKDVSFYEVFTNPESSEEYKNWQIRATTFDNARYKWGNNSRSEIYKNMVDGNDIALEYVDIPMKITDNIVYNNDDIVLNADGNLYGKVWNKYNNAFETVLLDADVISIRQHSNSSSYQYQKSNDDIYEVSRATDYRQSSFNTPFLGCTNAIKGLGVFASSTYIDKEGAVVFFGSDNTYKTISPIKYFNSSSWAITELLEADELGILKAVIDTDFGAQIIRKDFCALVIDMCESYMGKELPVSSANPFKDVKDEDNMNYKAILKAYNAGIINGTSATEFSPYNTISREQMASMMYRASKFLNSYMQYGEAVQFTDSYRFSSWSVEGISAMSSLGVIKGSNGEFNPSGEATVEQASAMILRLFKRIK